MTTPLPDLSTRARRDADTSAHSAGAGEAVRGTALWPEEATLVGQLLEGDEAAFAGLVEQYHGRLLRLAMVFVSDRASAEEVVQDTWLAVLTGLRSFERRSSLKTWIFSILTNRAKTRGQRDKRFVPFSALSGEAGAEEPAVSPSRFTLAGSWSNPPARWEEDTPEQLLLRRETLALVERTIADLPAGQRAVVTLRDVEGLESADVCNVLGITETNQRVLLHRGRARIRAALEQHVRSR